MDVGEMEFIQFWKSLLSNKDRTYNNSSLYPCSPVTSLSLLALIMGPLSIILLVLQLIFSGMKVGCVIAT